MSDEVVFNSIPIVPRERSLLDGRVVWKCESCEKKYRPLPLEDAALCPLCGFDHNTLLAGKPVEFLATNKCPVSDHCGNNVNCCAAKEYQPLTHPFIPLHIASTGQYACTIKGKT